MDNLSGSWRAGVFLTAVILQGLPVPGGEGLYWYNGMMNYMPFIFLAFLNSAFIIEYYYSVALKKKGIILVMTFLSFIISGGNHVTSF